MNTVGWRLTADRHLVASYSDGNSAFATVNSKAGRSPQQGTLRSGGEGSAFLTVLQPVLPGQRNGLQLRYNNNFVRTVKKELEETEVEICNM